MPTVMFHIYNNEEVTFVANLIRVLKSNRTYYFRTSDSMFAPKNSKSESTFIFPTAMQLVSFNFSDLLNFWLIY